MRPALLRGPAAWAFRPMRARYGFAAVPPIPQGDQPATGAVRMEKLDTLELFSQFVTERNDAAAAGPSVRDVLHDRERLREIAALRLTDPDVGHLLNDICRDASRALGLPMGLVTVLLDEAQHFAGQHGLGGWLAEAGGTPVEWSFCQYTVAAKQGFVVEDARTHALVQHNPLVLQDGLRCYAGMPLVTSRGLAVGSLCVVGPDTHEFTASDLETLRRFAAEAVRRLETRRTAVTS